MSSCLMCDYDTKTFTFHKAKITFETAQDRCKENGGKLAQDLDASTYAAFLRCCPDRKSYWIGLKNVQCGNKRSSGYQWIGGKTCNDGSPLNLETQPVNNNECKAVALELDRSDHNRNLPRARVKNCNNAKINYICQKEKISTTTIPRPKATTSSHKITQLSSTTVPKTTTVSALADNKTIDSSRTKMLVSDSTSSPEAIAGALISCILLLLIAALFFYCRKKKSNLSKKLNCFQSIKKSKKATDETKIKKTYFTWVFEAIVDKIWF